MSQLVLLKILSGITKEDVIDRVEVEARRDPEFRLCLTGVWYGTDLSEEIRNTIEKHTYSSPKLSEL